MAFYSCFAVFSYFIAIAFKRLRSLWFVIEFDMDIIFMH